ncbi:related to DEG1 - pseudouridine synthase [Melanopsichium pennsylvanicum]|uniref:Related to DEG1 - pseudouridine synthase n=2 Tax=Melanopsichium pennsylvanicum TaxID=63383 RepID=A0AAJ4XQ15_9BASI|nr:related to DEG1-pseudouridine synthase [Melanopsichium pennsylvanicum 4]SNX87024.1 related to DEG1 - pseudouridine synthase [Melanopsichium pennsylvanicum]
MEAKERYRDWTKESLLSRIAELEAQATASRAAKAESDTIKHVASFATPHPSPPSNLSNASALEPAAPSDAVSADLKEVGEVAKDEKAKAKGKGKKEKKPKVFDFTTSPCRKIALRFSYDGAGYSGLAAQNSTVPGSGSSLPTIEAVLWDALCTTRLVDPALGMEGSGFSRCGRTDRGVSAAGQVVALWVRSKKTNQWRQRIEHQEQFSPSHISKATPQGWEELEAKRNARLESVEMPYVIILNRILPASIRIQAWSPVRPNFSSRFDCTYRHYKYFFASGPPSIFFPPQITAASSSSINSSNAVIDSGATRLDIDLMRDGARRLLGEHDFRNLCKIDASKQITNYRRRIDGVSIDRVSSHWPTSSASVHDNEGDAKESEQEHMFVLNLRGTAFLYHQVRNIMAILFLIGARLERPEVIEELMNTEKGGIAADRVKMRLAATQSQRATANSSAIPNGNEEITEEGNRGEIKWWLPVNATSNVTSSASASSSRSATTTPEGLPMWIAQALNSNPEDHATCDSELEVYATKPNYEMAADRPLILWECGFLPSDIEWRVGTYDGALADISNEEQVENLNTASSSILRVHKTWTQLAISTELSRHFVLSSPSAHMGTLPSRTVFNHASFPCLPTTTCTAREDDENQIVGEKEIEVRQERRVTPIEVGRSGVIPLGNGTGRGATNYIALKQRPREETYEVKNRRWAETTGKRRAEKKQTENLIASSNAVDENE